MAATAKISAPWAFGDEGRLVGIAPDAKGWDLILVCFGRQGGGKDGEDDQKEERRS